MTAEQRTIIQPTDILAIELECKDCGSRVRYALLKMQPQVFRSRKHECPNCKQRLTNDSDTNYIADLADALRILIEGHIEAKIQLEVQGANDGLKAEAR